MGMYVFRKWLRQLWPKQVWIREGWFRMLFRTGAFRELLWLTCFSIRSDEFCILFSWLRYFWYGLLWVIYLLFPAFSPTFNAFRLSSNLLVPYPVQDDSGNRPHFLIYFLIWIWLLSTKLFFFFISMSKAPMSTHSFSSSKYETLLFTTSWDTSLNVWSRSRRRFGKNRWRLALLNDLVLVHFGFANVS